MSWPAPPPPLNPKGPVRNAPAAIPNTNPRVAPATPIIDASLRKISKMSLFNAPIAFIGLAEGYKNKDNTDR